MFARILEMKTKRGQARALCAVIEAKGVPILRKYPGLLDVICLIPGEAPDSVLALSFWESREAAEKYRIDSYATVAEIYQPFLEGGIHVRGCDVPIAPAYRTRVAKAS